MRGLLEHDPERGNRFSAKIMPEQRDAAQALASIRRAGFEIGRGIDAARDGVDNGDVDPHPGLQRAELLELSCSSSGEGGSRTNRSSAARR